MDRVAPRNLATAKATQASTVIYLTKNVVLRKHFNTGYTIKILPKFLCVLHLLKVNAQPVMSLPKNMVPRIRYVVVRGMGA